MYAPMYDVVNHDGKFYLGFSNLGSFEIPSEFDELTAKSSGVIGPQPNTLPCLVDIKHLHALPPRRSTQRNPKKNNPERVQIQHKSGTEPLLEAIGVKRLAVSLTSNGD